MHSSWKLTYHILGVFVGQVPGDQAVINSWDCSENQTREGALLFYHWFFFKVEVRQNFSSHVYSEAPLEALSCTGILKEKNQDLDAILSPADGSLHSSQYKARQKRTFFSWLSLSLSLPFLYICVIYKGQGIQCCSDPLFWLIKMSDFPLHTQDAHSYWHQWTMKSVGVGEVKNAHNFLYGEISDQSSFKLCWTPLMSLSRVFRLSSLTQAHNISVSFFVWLGKKMCLTLTCALLMSCAKAFVLLVICKTWGKWILLLCFQVL